MTGGNEVCMQISSIADIKTVTLAVRQRVLVTSQDRVDVMQLTTTKGDPCGTMSYSLGKGNPCD